MLALIVRLFRMVLPKSNSTPILGIVNNQSTAFVLIPQRSLKDISSAFASSFLPRCVWAYALVKVIDIRKHTTILLDKKK
jgi:hypothetical protein